VESISDQYFPPQPSRQVLPSLVIEQFSYLSDGNMARALATRLVDLSNAIVPASSPTAATTTSIPSSSSMSPSHRDELESVASVLNMVGDHIIPLFQFTSY
jgi:uncharacterized protein